MIGYYVHHHGLGHRNRATQIARELTVAVTGFSTLDRPADWPGEWVQLPPDVTEHPSDPTASGVLHWAPLGHPGHRERMGIMAQWLCHDLDLMVTDTSAEVTLLARLMGVPTVVMAMRGDRTDRTHRAAYDAATALIAPWSRETAETYWPEDWNRKTTFTGAISRFDVPTAAARGTGPAGVGPAVTSSEGAGSAVEGENTVLVLWGRGGTAVGEDDLAAARAATPGWTWTVRTPDNPSPDLWRELHEATVVVSHGGNNAVAELSAARAHAVVVAQPRPHDEQTATVAALDRAGICVGLPEWPAPERWPGLLDRALLLGGDRWRTWRHGDGAHRAARAMEAVLRGDAP
ncbi:glycosyltransferase [Kocuria tytonis]|uniref:Glycosyl transferase family 28 C-terminal domain-containing protein n=1 Tax=Kocuria tytonis TaxID=2054280 RepID=A0A495A9Y5_9MICC|nr:glycosyltransferase [Kocuria tytonis]RKQ36250.1 hypothetical protein C1C97_000750 [Kocuria tytonis]